MNPHYNKSTLLKRLNNYLYTPETVQEVKKFLEKGEYPVGLTNYEKWKYEQKWRFFEWKTNHLFYRPLNLMVITDENEKQEKMRELFKDLKTSLARGKRAFYYEISSKYLNIKRKDADNFLNKQKLYQITRPSFHQVNKPIIATKKLERFSIDLVDMSHYESTNEHYRYILTCIDNLTRRVFARPLKHKTAVDGRDAMESICDEGGAYPKLIHSDQGTEFRAECESWMKENGIKFVKSKSYSPESNGLIEAFNARLRKMIREIMIRFNTTKWITHLETCIESHNNRRNATIKAKPIDIWNADNTDEAAKNIKARAKKEVAKNKTTELTVGDVVRVKLTALYSKMRKIVKQNDKKKLVALWSPEVYRIKSIIRPDHEGLEKKRYTIETMNNNVVKKASQAMRFFATDMLKVSSDELKDGLSNQNFSNKDAMALNYNTKRSTRQQRTAPTVENRTEPAEEPVVVTEVPERRTTRQNTRGVTTRFNPTTHERVLVGGVLCSFV